ncbi:GNAT family N-acetyltransferase [Planctobacterium marinum]|uniref:GNAT family N-acetyltransferase n=1 Tax=Planctobacterium marinum TaxID=1631968 RepID=UPI001E38F77E|nr:GNAT family N-acetyltransferase [Planctobacterium marinum]MCC2603856.1 GNAT family N-acetyltransferase [Planctobacterium marinum]
MIIRADDVSDDRVVALLQEHIADMYATSPPESVHTLDLTALTNPDISFWCIWDGDSAAGCVALKEHAPHWAEIKSMRTANKYRGKGIGRLLLDHVIQQAYTRQYQWLRLETGAEPFFQPARTLYSKYGFEVRGPFADYGDDPHSVFMEKSF